MRYARVQIAISVMHLAMVGFASAGQWANWEWVEPTPQGFTLYSIASSSDSVVAVGKNGVIVQSHDGHEWEIAIPNQPGMMSDGTLYDVTWTGDKFIAVGSEKILTSPDGREWTVRLAPIEKQLSAIVWNGAEALAVGQFGISYTSQDGMGWQEHRLDNLPLAVMTDVAWDGAQYVAVGYENNLGDSAVFLSSDGRKWEIVQVSGVPIFEYNSIAWGNGNFVIVGGLWPGIPHVMISEDGLSWTAVSVNTAGAFVDITLVDGRFVALGWDGLFATSDDGVVWSIHHEDTGAFLLGTTAFNGFLVAVGEFGMISTTIDGSDWHQVSTRSFDIGNDSIWDIARSDGGIYVAVGGGAMGMECRRNALVREKW